MVKNVRPVHNVECHVQAIVHIYIEVLGFPSSSYASVGIAHKGCIDIHTGKKKRCCGHGVFSQQ